MSAEIQKAIATAGQTFVQAIQTASRTTLTARAHLDLLDEITDWLVQAHIARDVLWNRYYDKVAQGQFALIEIPTAADAALEEGAPQ